MPDESLYWNLERSLYAGSEVALRGQPLTYDILLYPLILLPLLELPSSVDLFRAVQALNTILMNAAVFPAFALALRVTKKSPLPCMSRR